MNIMYMIFGLIVLAFIIAVIDYHWYGKKIERWTKKEILFFYFTRTLGEMIAFTLGVIFTWRLLS